MSRMVFFEAAGFANTPADASPLKHAGKQNTVTLSFDEP